MGESKLIVLCLHDGLFSLLSAAAFLVARPVGIFCYKMPGDPCPGLFPQGTERVSRGEMRDVSQVRSKYSCRVNSSSDPLRPVTKEQARWLILEGLGEHFGSIQEVSLLMLTLVKEQAPVPPPCYQRAQARLKPALHLDALTLVRTLHLLALCHFAVRVAHHRCAPPLPAGPGGAHVPTARRACYLLDCRVHCGACRIKICTTG
jgi:hypothetical protein